mmetsp:Transcript_120140/g.347135  ORF Transcript_120140/g.347135 Transcript_120140/m.347135 type:complete len:97 (-) Transcript_120140:507-797(-)
MSEVKEFIASSRGRDSPPRKRRQAGEEGYVDDEISTQSTTGSPTTEKATARYQATFRAPAAREGANKLVVWVKGFDGTTARSSPTGPSRRSLGASE